MKQSKLGAWLAFAFGTLYFLVPLIATLLLDLLRRSVPGASVERFRFKGLRPTFDVSPFTVEGGPGDDARHFRLWSTDNRGQVGMEAEAWTR